MEFGFPVLQHGLQTLLTLVLLVPMRRVTGEGLERWIVQVLGQVTPVGMTNICPPSPSSDQ